MKAGRELDALVAEKVMGLAWDESRCRICGWGLKGSVDGGCVIDNCCERPAPMKRADEPGRYSTDIAIAWKVVEKLGEMDLSFAPDDRDGTWDCSFGWDGSENNPTCVYAPTAPEAICLSALKAVDE